MNNLRRFTELRSKVRAPIGLQMDRTVFSFFTNLSQVNHIDPLAFYFLFLQKKSKGNSVAFYFLKSCVIKMPPKLTIYCIIQMVGSKKPTLFEVKALENGSLPTIFYQPIGRRFSSSINKSRNTYLTHGLFKHSLGLNPLLKNRVLPFQASYKICSQHKKHKGAGHKVFKTTPFYLTYIRPLLDFKRETITRVCQNGKIPVYPDKSNRSLQYSRNRIRNQILPSLKFLINPNVEEALFKIAELLNKEQSFLYYVLNNTFTNE